MAVDYLQVESLTKSYGDNLLFEDLSFSVQNDRKIALVARNGAGKTSLLRIVVGEDTADSGLVTFRSDIRVAYLSQDPKMDAEKTVMEQIFSADTEELQIIRQYEEALENNDTTAIERLIGEMERLQLWDFEQQIKQILTKLRIHNYEQKIGHLSGGQRKRIALAHCLVNKPDLIILDEPTNHLDLDMIEWLEEYLNRTQAALLMVTHDRYFLDRICNEIIEIDNKTLFSYKGNYSEFLVKRDERIELQNLMAEKAKNLLRTEQDWMNRQPQARGTKAKYRIDNFYKLKDQAGSGYSSSQFDFEIQSRRLGSKILEMEAVNKNWGSLVTLKDFSYIFSRNEKIGIVGKNGVGKSTFLNIITGALEADSGKIETGETVVYGYYRQDGMVLDEQKRMIEVIQDIAEIIPQGNGRDVTASQFLEQFLFPRTQHYTYVYKLSGGEKRRLYLMTVLMKNPNFLILDEPTNDLDIMTLQVLEDYLKGFNGCALIVSHDRFFMDRVVDTLFIFEGEGIIKPFIGNYSDYYDRRKEGDKKLLLEKQEKQVTKEKPVGERQKKLSYKERQEYEGLEAEIERLQQEKSEIETALSSGIELDFEQVTRRYNEVNARIDEKELRWLELSELA